MIGPGRPLVLGSASPRRREILGSLSLPLLVLPADIVEDTEPSETPEAYLERIALGKLEAVARRLEQHPERATAAALLVADTTVVIDSHILGKPSNIAEAAAMLTQLTGRTHRVLTRYLIAAPSAPAQPLRSRTVETQVTLRRASAGEIERYAATGEGLDKAGAYAAQGIGTFLVERVDGSYSNVVGLPACEVVVDLRSCGLLGDFPIVAARG
jgi:nucleoside triphosphate pyrophosphatase